MRQTKMTLIYSLIVSLMLGFANVPASGQDTTKPKQANKTKQAKDKKTAQKKPKTNPALLPLKEIDPKLPNVLIIGDSISIGYTIATRKELAGVANLFRPLTNCGPTTRGLEGMDSWLGDRKWDVIHFNFGLHDLKYISPNSGLADPKNKTSRQQVPPEDYAANLKKIAQRLKKTGAVVIWRETTPVPKGAKGRIVGDSKKYNEIAAKVMMEVGDIETDAMFAFATESVPQLPANVHYSQQSSAKLAKHVAEVITKALNAKSK